MGLDLRLNLTYDADIKLYILNSPGSELLNHAQYSDLSQLFSSTNRLLKGSVEDSPKHATLHLGDSITLDHYQPLYNALQGLEYISMPKKVFEYVNSGQHNEDQLPPPKEIKSKSA